jgi:hypothetical protein
MSTANKLQPIRYEALEDPKVSDHKPVIAEFKMEIKTEDKIKKNQLVDHYLFKQRKNLPQNDGHIIQAPNTGFPKTHYKY